MEPCIKSAFDDLPSSRRDGVQVGEQAGGGEELSPGLRRGGESPDFRARGRQRRKRCRASRSGAGLYNSYVNNLDRITALERYCVTMSQTAVAADN